MKEQKWGRIVNITSLWSIVVVSNHAAYCSTKFGLDGFTVALATELAPFNILVNAVAPGYVETEATAVAFTSEQLSDVCRTVPIGRLAKPAEIAALVAWLVGEDNTYLTGQNILIDGGLART